MVPRLIEAAPPSISVSPVDTLPCWDLKSNLSTRFFEEAVDSMRFISLETTDESLLGMPMQIQKIGDRLVVVDLYKAQKIAVFDMTGKFLHTIGAKGNGPGEYNSLNDVVVNSEGVAVLDWLTWKYIRYDLEGKVLSEHRFQNGIPETIMQLDENTFVGSHAGYYPRDPYHLTWINKQDSILNTALPFRDPHGKPAGTLQYTHDGTLLFYHTFCDTIYQITTDKVIPRWRMGLYQPEEVDEWLKRTSEMDNKEYHKSLYSNTKETIINLFRLIESKRFWTVSFQDGRYAYFSVVDKSNGTSRNYIRLDMAEQKFYVPFIFTSTADDWLFSFIYEQFDFVLDKNERERFLSQVTSEKDREMLNNYDPENQNPIVCMFHLK